MSECIRGQPAGAVLNWDGLNGASCHDRMDQAIATLPDPDAQPFVVFAYRLVPLLFNLRGGPVAFDFPALLGRPASDFPSAVEPGFEMLGFDSVALTPFRPATDQWAACLGGFNCSPLSCNNMAEEIRVNRFCLLDDLDAAMAAATRFGKEEPEPGPYVIVEVLRQKS